MVYHVYYYIIKLACMTSFLNSADLNRGPAFLSCPTSALAYKSTCAEEGCRTGCKSRLHLEEAAKATQREESKTARLS